MKSIVLIFPYFGDFPPQFKMWKASALCNSDIDFLIFTDNDINSVNNIKVIKCSFDDFSKIIQQAFDFPIVLDRPYKLCEYKPAYGYALQDYIKQYDFWGFGDMDLVYGNIRHFLTDEILNKYKMFLGWGHLSIYKNEYETNTYFMQEIEGYQSYKDAYSTPTITFFDEYMHMGTSDKWKDTRPTDCWLEDPFDNVSKPKQSFHFNSLNRQWKNVIFEHINNELYMIKYSNGEIIRKESLYAHFQHRSFMKDKVSNNYSHFLITPTSIINYPKEYLSKLVVRFYCRNRNLTTLYFQWKDRIVYKLECILRFFK